CGTGPITNAVAFALRLAQPGDVIGVIGDHPHLFITAAPNPCHPDEVGWANDAVVHDVSIVGEDATARIQGIEIAGGYTQIADGGVDRITFKALTIRNVATSRTPFITHDDGRNGMIRVYDCAFEPVDPNAYNGNGMKWGIRGYLSSWDIRGNTVADAS